MLGKWRTLGGGSGRWNGSDSGTSQPVARRTARMTFLLDVNVLIALIDPVHVQHDAAHAWFAAYGQRSWATCPLTENGVLRIVGNARYPNSPGTPAAVAPLMAGMRSLCWHVLCSYGSMPAGSAKV